MRSSLEFGTSVEDGFALPGLAVLLEKRPLHAVPLQHEPQVSSEETQVAFLQTNDVCVVT